MDTLENGDRRFIDGTEYIHYHGYWVRYYEPLEESMASRKRLIDSLTRRAFHHTEPGINTPGHRLEEARAAYEAQLDPALKRVNAAMLAGALFNRATDLFNTIVDLEAKGVKVSRDNELMRLCSACFEEALDLGTEVRHFSGEEGIDEVWGEPFRAFTLGIDFYYETRFIKVAQTMANIDRIAGLLKEVYGRRPEFKDVVGKIEAFARAARDECETMKTDPDIFTIWPRFVATGEALAAVTANIPEDSSTQCRYATEEAEATLHAGSRLINWIARARVPMPVSTRSFEKRCRQVEQRLSHCEF
ncbi:MAG: hypothetical protein CSA54_04890 [Gammaproteobacteria bacterium]|nr:MAG: hypothetical protein CSA54_04890 [Gammaproteobacteria bacterium]